MKSSKGLEHKNNHFLLRKILEPQLQIIAAQAQVTQVEEERQLLGCIRAALFHNERGSGYESPTRNHQAGKFGLQISREVRGEHPSRERGEPIRR